MNIVESIERFAQRDMKGTMTKDVLTMLWKLAERHEILRGPAFTVQVKILELSCERQKDCMVGKEEKHLLVHALVFDLTVCDLS